SRPYILLYTLGAQSMTHATLSSGLAPYTLVVLRLLGALVWPTGGTPAKAPIARQTAEAGEGVTKRLYFTFCVTEGTRGITITGNDYAQRRETIYCASRAGTVLKPAEQDFKLLCSTLT